MAEIAGVGAAAEIAAEGRSGRSFRRAAGDWGGGAEAEHKGVDAYSGRL